MPQNMRSDVYKRQACIFPFKTADVFRDGSGSRTEFCVDCIRVSFEQDLSILCGDRKFIEFSKADAVSYTHLVPGYVIAQMAGAFVGASIVYLLFKGQFDATEDPGTKLGVFCTGCLLYTSTKVQADFMKYEKIVPMVQI